MCCSCKHIFFSVVSTGSENLTWFVQLSDLHISQYKDIGRVDHLLEFTDSSLNILNPAAVIVTGLENLLQEI